MIRKLILCTVLGLFSFAAIAAEKPSPEFVKAMKDLAAANQAITKSVAAGDFNAVASNAGNAVNAIPVVQAYWKGKAPDASKAAEDAAKAAADLRVAAGLQSQEGIEYSAKMLGATCGQCHTAHRSALPDGTYEIK